MTKKQTILGRIGQLTRANINALLDRAEDPEKMLDQMVRDFTNAIADAEEAVAQTIAGLRMAEADYKEDISAAEDWGRKALAASQRADQMRASGDEAGAGKFDTLAKTAITKQIQHENEAKQAEPSIASQRQAVEKLKSGLVTMKTQLGDLKSRRDALVARARSAEAQEKVQKAMGSISVLDPTSELSRFEDRIRRQEALASGRAEAQAATLDSQFEELEASSANVEVEARLAALKSGGSPKAVTSGQGAPATADDEVVEEYVPGQE